MPRSLRWVVVAALGLTGALYAWRSFPRAFSILALDLRMDRAGALAAAESLAVAQGFGPDHDVRTAVVFELDGEAQTFIELEGGGPEVFKRAVQDGSYHAYTWQVRRVAPEEVNETWIVFTPAGSPLGFRETIAEDAAGPALARDSARAIAERAAGASWHIDLGAYTLHDATEELKPSGRRDHTFTYEALSQPFGDGRLRLDLAVAGDRLVEVERYLHVPEAFQRRYDNIRAANEVIAEAALGAMIVVYGIGGIGVGLVVMLRRRMIVWRPALVAGMVFGVLAGLSLLNAWPFFWLEYVTTAPVATYVALAVGLGVLASLATAVQVGLSALAAESLSRAAFPHHPQFWKLWSREAGSSREVLERTLLGYLLIGVFLGYMVAFWRLSSGRAGWWNPTETLLQPNLFATYLPWLGPVAVAIQAGFWEECLFRAVPLAGAALLGERFGRRSLWLGAALAVQALIFAAAHANYPAQPPYARLVELLLPSFLFAGVYLRWGLLPAIVLHAGYDLALLSLPLFAADSPGIWWNRGMVLAVALVPLGILTWRRGQVGRWISLPEKLWNRGWVGPAPRPPESPPALRTRPAAAGMRWLLPIAAIAIAAWAWFSDWSPPPVELRIGRERAIALARAELEGGGGFVRPGTLADGWRPLASAQSGQEDAGPHDMVWETAGDSMYFALLQDALPGPHWRVRFAQFEGDVAERAEEWIVRVGPAGQITGLAHRVPESRPGARLEEAAARALTDSVVAARADGDYHLVRISSDRRPARTDWTATYVDSSIALPTGDVRARVTILGDEIGGVERFVFVPETYQRTKSRETLVRTIPGLVFATGIVVLFLAGLIGSVVRSARGQSDRRVGMVLFAGLVPLGLLAALSAWPATIAEFETSRPWGIQAGLAAAWSGFGAVMPPAAFATILAALLPRSSELAWRPDRIWPALAFLLAGAEAALSSLRSGRPSLEPGALDSRWPFLNVVAGVPVGFVAGLAFFVLPFWVGDRLGRKNRRVELAWYLVIGGAIAVVFGGDIGLAAQTVAFVAGAAVFALLAEVVRRTGRQVLIGSLLLWQGLTGLPEVWAGGPREVLGFLLGLGISVLLARAAWWSLPGSEPESIAEPRGERHIPPAGMGFNDDR